MLKIVLDTNALIDGSDDFYNYSSRIIDLVLAGQVEAYANHGTLRENRLLAQRKIHDGAYLRKLEYFFDLVKTSPGLSLNGGEVELEDQEDLKILESAVNSYADYLITSDRHLLKLGKFRRVKIVRPDAFWSIWEDEGDIGWSKWLRNFIN